MLRGDSRGPDDVLRLVVRLLDLVGRVVVDVHAEVGRKPGQAVVVALADGPELPLLTAAVQLAEDEGAHRPGVIDREPQQAVAGPVGQGHPKVVQLSETSAPVPARRDDRPLHVRRNRRQVEDDAVLAALPVGALPRSCTLPSAATALL